MSKLRANIIYNHWLQTNISLPNAQTIISDVNFSRYNEIEEEILTNTKNNENLQETTTPLNDQIEELDEETEIITNLEEEFGIYLQGWADILEEEKKAFNNKEFDEIEEKNISLELKDIIHPVINTNAKWELVSLFKELDLPFK